MYVMKQMYNLKNSIYMKKVILYFVLFFVCQTISSQQQEQLRIEDVLESEVIEWYDSYYERSLECDVVSSNVFVLECVSKELVESGYTPLAQQKSWIYGGYVSDVWDAIKLGKKIAKLCYNKQVIELRIVRNKDGWDVYYR